jgi:hypothetical protein
LGTYLDGKKCDDINGSNNIDDGRPPGLDIYALYRATADQAFVGQDSDQIEDEIAKEDSAHCGSPQFPTICFSMAVDL